MIDLAKLEALASASFALMVTEWNDARHSEPFSPFIAACDPATVLALVLALRDAMKPEGVNLAKFGIVDRGSQ